MIGDTEGHDVVNKVVTTVISGPYILAITDDALAEGTIKTIVDDTVVVIVEYKATKSSVAAENGEVGALV